jgi:hypothetical protein
MPSPLGPWIRRALCAATVALLANGCATYSDDLQRGVKYYDANEHERSLAIFRSLEPDMDSLRPEDRVRYYYYRGMTGYRLASDTYKVRPDARHWLGLARAAEGELPAALSEEQKARLTEALDDLNRDVFGGADSMADLAPKDKEKEGKKDKAKTDDSAAEKPKKKKKAADDEEAAPAEEPAPKKKKKKPATEE